MNTATRFMAPDDIDEFVQETLADDYLYSVGYQDAEIGLCPFITFYIYHQKESFLRIAQQMLAINEEFQQLIDEPFQLVLNRKTDDWISWGRSEKIDWNAHAQRCAENEHKSFWLMATDQKSAVATPRWAFAARVTDTPEMCYTILKLTFRHHWYNRNRTRWHTFVSGCVRRLQPDQCYSGFEVGNGGFSVLGNYECETLERICADYFYGMDVDHPSKMGFHYFDNTSGWSNPTRLGVGLRPPVWSFMLSPNWLSMLGKTEDQVRAELDDPRIAIESIPFSPGKLNPDGRNGLWIRLGELDLHPVDKGVPDLLVKANRLIRPIRCNQLKLLSLDPWDDDPNPRFNYMDSLRWMARFDDDSDWPSVDRRINLPPVRDESLRVLHGHIVPRTGWWHTPALDGNRGMRYFREGERFPEQARNEWGEVIWHFDPGRQPTA